MSIKKAIVSHLEDDAPLVAIFANRIIPQFVASDVSTPYLIFDRATTEQVNNMSGVSSLRKETFIFLIYADTRIVVEDAKQKLQTALNALRRTTVEGVTFSGAFEVSTSDDFEVRGAADQEPAYNEVISFTFWISS